jgi:hypothetical protein
MKAIGEEPQEFAKFRDEFRNPIKPNDDFEDLLACKMVAARWRQFRLLRAEAAILAQSRCQFVMKRRRQGSWPSPLMAKAWCVARRLGGERTNKAGMSFRFRVIGPATARSIKDFGLRTGGGWEGSERTKSECPLDSESLSSRLHDQSRIWIADRRRLGGERANKAAMSFRFRVIELATARSIKDLDCGPAAADRAGVLGTFAPVTGPSSGR